MGLINQWEDVTSIDCTQVGNGTCYRNGTDVLDYYGFKTVCRKKMYTDISLYVYFLGPFQS